MPDGLIFDSLVGPNTSHYYLTGVHANPYQDWDTARLAQRVGVAPDSVLELERRVNSTLRIVSVRYRSAEQGKDSVTGGLHDASIKTADHLDHNFQGWIDQPACIFGIERLQEIH